MLVLINTARAGLLAFLAAAVILTSCSQSAAERATDRVELADNVKVTRRSGGPVDLVVLELDITDRVGTEPLDPDLLILNWREWLGENAFRSNFELLTSENPASTVGETFGLFSTPCSMTIKAVFDTDPPRQDPDVDAILSVRCIVP